MPANRSAASRTKRSGQAASSPVPPLPEAEPSSKRRKGNNATVVPASKSTGSNPAVPSVQEEASGATTGGAIEGRGARKRKSTPKAAASLEKSAILTERTPSGSKKSNSRTAAAESTTSARAGQGAPKAKGKNAVQARDTVQSLRATAGGIAESDLQDETVVAGQDVHSAKEKSTTISRAGSSKSKTSNVARASAGAPNSKRKCKKASVDQAESSITAKTDAKPKGRKKEATSSIIANQPSDLAFLPTAHANPSAQRDAVLTAKAKGAKVNRYAFNKKASVTSKASRPKQITTDTTVSIEAAPPTSTTAARQIVPRRFAAQVEEANTADQESEAVVAAGAPETSTDASAVANTADASGDASKPKPKKVRKPRKDKGIKRPSKVKMVDSGTGTELGIVAVDPLLNTADSTGTAPSSKTKRKPKAVGDKQPKEIGQKRKSVNDAATGAADDAGEAEADGDNAPKPKRRKRAGTPDDGDLKPIDSGATLMHELTRDVKVSQISEAETHLRTVDWGQLKKDKQSKYEEAMNTAIEDTRSGKMSTRTTQKERSLLLAEAEKGGPATKLKAVRQPNGALAFVTTAEVDEEDDNEGSDNEQSPVDDNRSSATPTASTVVLETKYTTKPFNTHTKIHERHRNPAEREVKYAKASPWTEEDTEAFYSALSMWGTDFSIINALFPMRTRRQIKLKFVREERADPVRVNRALIQETVPMDIGKFASMTGKEDGDFKEPGEVMEALEAEKEVQMAELEREKAEAKKAVDVGKARAKERQEAAARSKRKAKEGKEGARRKVRASEAASEVPSVKAAANKVRASQAPAGVSVGGRDEKRATAATEDDVDEDDGDNEDMGAASSRAVDDDGDDGDDGDDDDANGDNGEGREIILGYEDEDDDHEDD